MTKQNYRYNTAIQYFLYILMFFLPATIQSQQIRHLGITEGLNGRQAFNFVQDKMVLSGFLPNMVWIDLMGKM